MSIHAQTREKKAVTPYFEKEGRARGGNFRGNEEDRQGGKKDKIPSAQGQDNDVNGQHWKEKKLI